MGSRGTLEGWRPQELTEAAECDHSFSIRHFCRIPKRLETIEVAEASIVLKDGTSPTSPTRPLQSLEPLEKRTRSVEGWCGARLGIAQTAFCTRLADAGV